MSGPFELQRGPGQLVDLQQQLPQMHKDILFPVQEDKQVWQTGTACLNGEFLSHLTQTMKCMESVNSDRPPWRM